MNSSQKIAQYLIASYITLLYGSQAAHANTDYLIASGIQNAENSLQTSNHRLFVTGENGVFELVQRGAQWDKNPLPARFKDGRNANCYFLGITENKGMVYTLCAENILNPLSKKHLFAFDSNANGTPTVSEVAELAGVDFPNGLTGDGLGTLFVANSGKPLLAGKIHQIKLKEDHSVASQSVLHQFIACKPNGVRYSAGQLYVSLNPFSYLGISQLMRYDVTPNALINQTQLYSTWNFLDDFAVLDNGVLVTEFLAGKLRYLHKDGTPAESFDFSQPTSVRILHNNAGILVTERAAGQVKLIPNTLK